MLSVVRTIPLAFAAALLLLGERGAAQIISTNGAPSGPRTAVVVGQVIDGISGEPIPEAVVRLSMPAFLATLSTTPNARVMADADGRFFFTDLPAGEYSLSVTKDGYIAGTYGQRRASARGELLPLKEGERRTDVMLRAWKYAVIGGTVLDEAGEPVVGVAVRALIRDVVAGHTRFGTDSYNVPSTLTDDRGAFRLSRVQPGTYAVVAPSVHTTVPLAVMNSWDANTLRLELWRASVYEVSPLGQPRTQQVGDFALMTLNSVMIPPQPGADGRMSMYRTTYYPSATSASAGTTVSVAAGEERTDLAITMRPIPAARVSGRLVTPDGTAPPPMAIKLVGDAMKDVVTRSLPSSTAEVGFETATAVSDATGRFTMLGVPPGEYDLTHADELIVRSAEGGRTAYWVKQRITVPAGDLRDLVVNLRPALRIAGRVQFSPGVTPPTTLPPNQGSLTLENPAIEASQAFAPARNGEFSTIAPGGRYIAHAVENSGWFVESITLDGKDITERPFDLQTDATTFVVTYTNRASKVTGAVKDARGNVAADAIVLVFPTDQQRWTDYGRSPRFLRSVPMSLKGTYTLDHLPPGDYYVIAIEGVDGEGWRDPKVLQALANRADRVTVAAGPASQTLDLIMRSVR
ncbi:MAG TPA: carboxypeptidase-like regulatory domain-containing protein [Vicinamibacterales bacterium]|nr:carboxypeptidase-like regulatory domain-containing protein [Vicinamibacterales bacterium]